jgi:hypothetical protein
MYIYMEIIYKIYVKNMEIPVCDKKVSISVLVQ